MFCSFLGLALVYARQQRVFLESPNALGIFRKAFFKNEPFSFHSTWQRRTKNWFEIYRGASGCIRSFSENHFRNEMFCSFLGLALVYARQQRVFLECLGIFREAFFKTVFRKAFF